MALSCTCLCACASRSAESVPRAGLTVASRLISDDRSGTSAQAPEPWVSGYIDRIGTAAFTVDGSMPWFSPDERRLFGSSMRVQAEGGLLEAESRFQIETGDVIDVSEWAGGYKPRRPSSLGKQIAVQQMGTRIPLIAGVPLKVQWSQRQETLWLLNSQSRARELQQADFSWSPNPTAFSLSLSQRSGIAPSLLECGVQGGVKFATLGRRGAPVLQLRGRSCDVFSTRLPTMQTARGWSALLSWPRDREETALRVLALQPQPTGPRAAQFDADPAYELGLTRKQRLGHWRATGGVAMRRGSHTVDRAAELYWSADAQLRRSLRMLDLTATYRTGAADDWFLPLPAGQSERMALGVDLAPWFNLNMPTADIGMSQSYQWQRQESPLSRQIEDDVIQGRVRWTWLPPVAVDTRFTASGDSRKSPT